MYAAMSLVAAFFFMAGIYVLLSAHLIAFLQILVYAGAVMVLFLFVIMLLSLGEEHHELEQLKQVQWLGFVLGGGGLMALLAWISREVAGAGMAAVGADFGTVKAVGRVLFTQYLLPFEATSLLLTVAIVGAVVVAKEKIYMVPLQWYLLLAAVLFGIGLVGVLIKRNALVVMMCVELMLNAANLTFLAFSRQQGNVGGHAIAFFVIAVAAAEAAVGLAIVIAIYRTRGSVNIDEVRELREEA